MRADARRNRARILDVAERLLAERGVTTSTDEIARAAGVGIGTLFRHFPTKEDLIRGVFTARLRALADQADRLADANDPGDALATVMRATAAHGALKAALGALLDDVTFDTPEIAEVKRDLNQALSTLLANAQRAGSARPELRLGDLIGLLAGLARAMDFAGDDPQAPDRLLAVILAGLRPDPA
jgi:AcrR family transcriptional regulator